MKSCSRQHCHSGSFACGMMLSLQNQDGNYKKTFSKQSCYPAGVCLNACSFVACFPGIQMLFQLASFPQLPSGRGLILKIDALGVFESHLLILLQVTVKPFHKWWIFKPNFVPTVPLKRLCHHSLLSWLAVLASAPVWFCCLLKLLFSGWRMVSVSPSAGWLGSLPFVLPKCIAQLEE